MQSGKVGIPSLVLMERAALAVADEMEKSRTFTGSNEY